MYSKDRPTPEPALRMETTECHLGGYIIGRPAPVGGTFEAGTNTRAILEELGYSADETAALFASGVVTEPATEP